MGLVNIEHPGAGDLILQLNELLINQEEVLSLWGKLKHPGLLTSDNNKHSY